MKVHLHRFAGVSVCALALFATGIWAQTSSGSANRLASGDSTFATKAAQGGMAEVKLGELAKEKASSQPVKDFGQKMIDDHSKANDELKGIAGRKGITLPQSLDPKDQATYDGLAKLSGPAFDRDYMRDMVTDHRTDVNEFKREANAGRDPQVKSFAESTLPTLQEHLEQAKTTRGTTSAARTSSATKSPAGNANN